MEHKSHEQIQKEIEIAGRKVKVGGVYAHYKTPQSRYEVIAFGTQEADDKLCVIYKNAKTGLVFVRNLDDWLKSPSKEVMRFTQVLQ